MNGDIETAPATIDLRGIHSLTELARQVNEFKRRDLALKGALLFKTSLLSSVADFESLLTRLGSELMEYRFGSTPRHRLLGKVYTSTEYPAEQEIILHNEMAYTTVWPDKLWFFCETPAAAGGETPIADSRRIYRKIDHVIKTLFEEKGLLYVRNYRPGLDVSWQSVFDTNDKACVERTCREMGIAFEWQGKQLKTTQKCQATAIHPVSGEKVWFNQAHLFHVSNVPEEYRNLLLSMYKEDELPRNVLFGDGTPIDKGMLDSIRAVMASEKRKFIWERGDVMLLDNLLFAHGREPFSGKRKIAVAME